MNATEIQNALVKFAESDLRLARRETEITVAGTKRGAVSLKWDGANYSIGGATFENGEISSWNIAGPKRVIRAALVNLYVVAA